MTLDELEVDVTSTIWKGTMLDTPTPSRQAYDNSRSETGMFWMVGDDGSPVKMMWTEDGRMVEVDGYGYSGD